MGKLFLFGTGKISKKYTQVLNHLPIEIGGYVDNDKSKWGTRFWDRNVYSPDVLRQTANLYILVACAAKEEIIKQLEEMGLEKNVVSFCQILKFYGQALINTVTTSSPEKNSLAERVIVIDNLYGSWGGAEDWCHIVAAALLEQNKEVFVIENEKQPNTERLEKNIIHVDTKDKSHYQIYQELVRMLMHIRPFVLFNVWNSELLWAAATIKCAYPEDSFVISSVLNDDSYGEWHEWDEITDKYICISSKIQRKLIEYCKIQREKVCHISPFIEKIRIVNRKYSEEDIEPLKIGYPCRLVKDQKRADLIPQFIEYLESRTINYVLNIAGDGSCEREIKEYVEKKCLHEKVKLYGKLTKTELTDFLDHQDIYLNFSEYEGTSLTMLEAMASGCVPVVTNVSGVEDFIESGVNGLIADVGDLRKIADYIAALDENRSLLTEYGHKCMSIVHEKCRLDKYIENIGDELKSL